MAWIVYAVAGPARLDCKGQGLRGKVRNQVQSHGTVDFPLNGRDREISREIVFNDPPITGVEYVARYRGVMFTG